MTREEAFRLFGDLEDEDEIQDFYEEQLFDYKKFFLSKAPIAKLFEGRVRKLRKLGEAYVLISLNREGAKGAMKDGVWLDVPLGPGANSNNIPLAIPLIPGANGSLRGYLRWWSSRAVLSLPSKGEESILEIFKDFQKAKNELKRLISNAGSAEELVGLAEALVALEKENASHWEVALESEEDIIVSKEPDPMYLLEAIQAYRAKGGETFGQLKKLENNPPELLLQEMKRLSLLFKKF